MTRAFSVDFDYPGSIVVNVTAHVVFWLSYLVGITVAVCTHNAKAAVFVRNDKSKKKLVVGTLQCS